MKIVFFCLLVALVFSMVGCGSKSEPIFFSTDLHDIPNLDLTCV